MREFDYLNATLNREGDAYPLRLGRQAGRPLASAMPQLLAASLLLFLGAVIASPAVASASSAQAPAANGTATVAPSSVIGTVKEISGNTLTLTLANAQTLSVQAADGARVVRLAPGSTNLKTAEPITMKDVEVGDRVLVRGPAGSESGPATASSTASMTASLLVVMKQADIQQKHAEDLQDWQRRGSGGLVSAVDPAANTISISTVTASGPGKLLVKVTPKTIFRRYAADSVNFADAKAATFAEIKPGDQMRVRGTKSEDGTTLEAEEIVSGSFLNIAGTIASINPAANTLTVKDLATKKTVTVKLTANSSLHKLPPQMAAMFAARLHGGGGAGGPRGAGAQTGATGQAPAGGAQVASAAGSRRGVGQGAGAGGPGENAGGQAGFQGRAASAGAGISQAIARSPVVTLSDLKPNDAVMIVATPDNHSGAAAASGVASTQTVTAVTLLAGVEPILAATPTNSQPMSLSAWTIGGDMPSQ